MIRSLILVILITLLFSAAKAQENPLPIDILQRQTRAFERKIGFDEAVKNHVRAEKIVFDWSTLKKPPHLGGWKIMGKRRDATGGPLARERWEWGYVKKQEGVGIKIIAHKISADSALLAIRDFAHRSNMMEPPYLKGPSDLGTLSVILPGPYGYEIYWAYRDLEFSVEATNKELALKTAHWLNSVAQAHRKPRE